MIGLAYSKLKMAIQRKIFGVPILSRVVIVSSSKPLKLKYLEQTLTLVKKLNRQMKKQSLKM
jgi:hypothetical protein